MGKVIRLLGPLIAALAVLSLFNFPHFAIHPAYGVAARTGITMLMMTVAYRGSRRVAGAMCVLLPLYGWYMGFTDAAMLPFEIASAAALLFISGRFRPRRWASPLAAALAAALVCALGTLSLLLWRKEMSLASALVYALTRQLRPWAAITVGAMGAWILRREWPR